MKKVIKLICAVFAISFLFWSPEPAHAVLEIKEINLLNKCLGNNFDAMKSIYKVADNMKEDARPFNRRRHRDRYRFEPGIKDAKNILNQIRSVHSNFKIMSGTLGQARIDEHDIIFNQLADVAKNITVYCKRALRANKDYNFALYMAAAQGIQREIIVGNSLLNDLEIAINNRIAETDSMKEDF